MSESVVVAWSGGKDSAMALYETAMVAGRSVAALLSTITEDFGRVSMHGIREALLEEQARCIGLPLDRVYIPAGSSNELYEARMRDRLLHYIDRGVGSVVFGDIFLEDLRRYREGNLAQIGMRGLFPLWNADTAELANRFMDLGFKTVVTCVDTDLLDGKFVGRLYGNRFLAELPSSVDPCGENGEFHSFVYDGPIFRESVRFRKGDVVLRENRFCFCDLLPDQAWKLEKSNGRVSG